MRRTNALRACGAALLAVSLAGCMKINMELELNTDDTVDGTMVVAFNQAVSDFAESMGEDPSTMFDEMETDLPDNAEVEDYEDDEFTGKQYTFNGADLAEFAEDSDGFGIVHEGDEFVVNGEMDMSQINPDDMGGLEDQLGSDFNPEAMMESFDVSLSITFPGEVIEHNGELDGTTVTWVPEPGENLEISARAKDSGAGGMPVWAWIVIALVAVAAIIALLFFLARNRGKEATADQAPAGVAAAGGAAAGSAAAGSATADGSTEGSATAGGAAPPPPPAGDEPAGGVSAADDASTADDAEGDASAAGAVSDTSVADDEATSTDVAGASTDDAGASTDAPDTDGDERR